VEVFGHSMEKVRPLSEVAVVEVPEVSSRVLSSAAPQSTTAALQRLQTFPVINRIQVNWHLPVVQFVTLRAPT
jgi:hypothetical protein